VQELALFSYFENMTKVVNSIYTILNLRRISIIITLNNAVINMWIYEHPNWPNFSWNAETLASRLADIRHRQGRLLGRMEGVYWKNTQKW